MSNHQSPGGRNRMEHSAGQTGDKSSYNLLGKEEEDQDLAQQYLDQEYLGQEYQGSLEEYSLYGQE